MQREKLLFIESEYPITGRSSLSLAAIVIKLRAFDDDEAIDFIMPIIVRSLYNIQCQLHALCRTYAFLYVYFR